MMLRSRYCCAADAEAADLAAGGAVLHREIRRLDVAVLSRLESTLCDACSGLEIKEETVDAHPAAQIRALAAALRAASAAPSWSVTVGWLYRALGRYGREQKQKQQQQEAGTTADDGLLLPWLTAAVAAEAAERASKTARMDATWSVLRKMSRQYCLDVVPRLAFCRGALVDLIVRSGE